MKLTHIHSFPARMAPEIVFKRLESLPKAAIVMDPMSGSGTVLRAAAEMGHDCIGFDMDPLAVLMARVWTTAVDTDEIEPAARAAVAEAMKGDMPELPWMRECEETRRFVSFWFEPTQEEALSRLASVLARRVDAVGDVLRVALSRIVITKERGASIARDTSHSRPHRVFFDNNYDVYAGFFQSASRLAGRLHPKRLNGNVVVNLGDARRLEPLADHSVDAIITSPPYLNAIDYLRGHRLALIWFGYSIMDLRSVRGASIGAESSAIPTGAPDISSCLAVAGNIDALPSRERGMVIRYAVDIQQLMTEMARMLKPGGTAVLVVGNSCLRGVMISNACINVAAAEHAGMKLKSRIERELPAASRYLPPPTGGTASLAKRMKTETILELVA